MPRIIALLVLMMTCPLICPTAGAADVAMIGAIGDKAAVLAIDGGNPKTVKVGQTWSGITVIAVERDQATVEIDGKRQVLRRGQHYRSAGAMASERQSITLAADSRGHFFSDGAINGNPTRFIVDTGATVIALPASEAQRLGIDYRKGQAAITATAGGMVDAFRIRLDRVKLGDIELTGVDAVVIEKGLTVNLLGMSFLNRVEMKREGETMTLIRRF
jgi:aspartyl protease family protein